MDISDERQGEQQGLRTQWGALSLPSLIGLILLVGCGGGGDDETISQNEDEPTSTPAPAPDPNTAPEISAELPETALINVAFNYTPDASDADNDTLTFSAENLPPWLSINRSTGELSGTPEAGDVGNWENVVLTVSDGTVSASTAALSVNVVDSLPGTALINWQPPTQKADGSPLTDLAGYTIYYGASESAMDRSVEISNAGLTSYVVEGLSAGSWYFSMDAVRSNGLRSGRSAILQKSVL